MKNNYPYLRDPRALAEIRKHQWIESQKAGQDIGFGSAALDWISRYGQAWQQACAKGLKDRRFFLEQRKYRRFDLQSTVMLIQGKAVSSVMTIDVSSQGLLCKTRRRIALGSKVDIRWSFGLTDPHGLEYTGTIERISDVPDSQEEYLLLIKFSENSKKQIENFSFLIGR